MWQLKTPNPITILTIIRIDHATLNTPSILKGFSFFDASLSESPAFICRYFMHTIIIIGVALK